MTRLTSAYVCTVLIFMFLVSVSHTLRAGGLTPHAVNEHVGHSEQGRSVGDAISIGEIAALNLLDLYAYQSLETAPDPDNSVVLRSWLCQDVVMSHADFETMMLDILDAASMTCITVDCWGAQGIFFEVVFNDLCDPPSSMVSILDPKILDYRAPWDNCRQVHWQSPVMGPCFIIHMCMDRESLCAKHGGTTWVFD
jgi:hypothetical protein